MGRAGMCAVYARVCTSLEFGPHSRMLNSCVLLRGETDGTKEVRNRNVLPLFRCLMKEESDRNKLTLVR